MYLINKQSVKVAREERIDCMQFRGAFNFSPRSRPHNPRVCILDRRRGLPQIEGRVDVSNPMKNFSEAERHVPYQHFAVNPDIRTTLSSTERERKETAIDNIGMILDLRPSRAELDIDTATEQLTVPAFA